MALSVEERPVSEVVIASGAGSIERSFAGILSLGSPRMVKVADWPGVTLVTSASEIWALITMVSRLAILTMVGEVWLALTLWPSVTSTATIVPSVGAMILVRDRARLASSTASWAWLIWALNDA